MSSAFNAGEAAQPPERRPDRESQHSRRGRPRRGERLPAPVKSSSAASPHERSTGVRHRGDGKQHAHNDVIGRPDGNENRRQAGSRAARRVSVRGGSSREAPSPPSVETRLHDVKSEETRCEVGNARNRSQPVNGAGASRSRVRVEATPNTQGARGSSGRPAAGAGSVARSSVNLPSCPAASRESSSMSGSA